MKLTKENWRKFEKGISSEWLITNGIGGFASSSVIGANTRRYHGLLIAAFTPQDRRMVLSKVDESITIGTETFPICSNQCKNGYIENGYQYQLEFSKFYYPEFHYKVKGIEINKKICMLYGENAVCVVYTIHSTKNATFRVAPLINYRDFHHVRRMPEFSYSNRKNNVTIELEQGHNLYLGLDAGEFVKHENDYFRDMYYAIERERGLEDTEDHFIPGCYHVPIQAGEEMVVTLIASVDKKIKDTGIEILKKEEKRLQALIKQADVKKEVDKLLVIAADNFLVKSGKYKTIIAGYPWFGDWGRDTFIAFEGLVLKTKRYEEAKNILLRFAQYIQNGLVPNLITADGGQAYNSVDASLWYIEAVYQYVRYTKDDKILKEIYPKLVEIVESYKRGTCYQIKMDKDKLIVAGDNTTQLTWMDAKVGDYVVTPRYGKAVEINALWYNALKCMEYLAEKTKEEWDITLAEEVKRAFKKFYAPDGLYDTIEPLSNQIRPNQLYAIGLTFPVVEGKKAEEIFQLVQEKLYTKKGLRTLNQEDPVYCGIYKGNVYERDTSYHQGTIWPFLLAIYASSYENVFHKKFKIENTETMLTEDCVGSICEIYDANEPHMPRGAFAQAWSIAAVLKNR